MGLTEQTDGRTDRYIDPAPHTMRTASITSCHKEAASPRAAPCVSL